MLYTSHAYRLHQTLLYSLGGGINLRRQRDAGLGCLFVRGTLCIKSQNAVCGEHFLFIKVTLTAPFHAAPVVVRLLDSSRNETRRETQREKWMEESENHPSSSGRLQTACTNNIYVAKHNSLTKHVCVFVCWFVTFYGSWLPHSGWRCAFYPRRALWQPSNNLMKFVERETIQPLRILLPSITPDGRVLYINVWIHVWCRVYAPHTHISGIRMLMWQGKCTIRHPQSAGRTWMGSDFVDLLHLILGTGIWENKQ